MNSRCASKSSGSRLERRLLFLSLALVLLMPAGLVLAQAVLAQSASAERKIGPTAVPKSGSKTTETARPVQKAFTGFFEGVKSKIRGDKEATKNPPQASHAKPSKPSTMPGSQSSATDKTRSTARPPEAATQNAKLPSTPQSTQRQPAQWPGLGTPTDEDEERIATAPLPPESNYFDKIAQQKESVAKAPPSIDPLLANALNPLESATVSQPVTSPPTAVQHDSFASLQQPAPPPMSTQPEEPMVASLSSYSFDTRDWVEYYPVENNAVEQDVVQQNYQASHTANNTSPSPSEATATTPKDWNGVATPIQNPQRQAPQASAIPVRKTAPESTSTASPTANIDLA